MMKVRDWRSAAVILKRSETRFPSHLLERERYTGCFKRWAVFGIGSGVDAAGAVRLGGRMGRRRSRILREGCTAACDYSRASFSEQKFGKSTWVSSISRESNF